MIEIYGFEGCVPCDEAEKWMNEQGISYVKKGIDDTISEYPTIVIDGKRFTGFGDGVKNAILESVKHG